MILTEVSQWADGMPAWGHEEDFGMHPPVDRATWEGCAEHDCSLNAARSCVASDEVRPRFAISPLPAGRTLIGAQAGAASSVAINHTAQGTQNVTHSH